MGFDGAVLGEGFSQATDYRHDCCVVEGQALTHSFEWGFSNVYITIVSIMILSFFLLDQIFSNSRSVVNLAGNQICCRLLGVKRRYTILARHTYHDERSICQKHGTEIDIRI